MSGPPAGRADLLPAFPDEPEGWHLTPEGAAVLPAEATAVIADVHLGYEWARGAGGDVVPAHSRAETIAKLDALFARTPIRRLVVAGDLVESAAPCPRTARDVAALADWLDGRGVELLRLRGNHDPPGLDLPDTLALAGWTIAHGHRAVAGRRIVGHHHPALRLDGRNHACFLVDTRSIVLPAFTPNAAGFDVGTGRAPAGLGEIGAARCIVAAAGLLLDFGRLAHLAARLYGV